MFTCLRIACEQNTNPVPYAYSRRLEPVAWSIIAAAALLVAGVFFARRRV